MDVVVVSIGTLSKNPFWQERTAVRTSHATTTLIHVDDAFILVDPSLPAQALEQRLFERSGLKPQAITHIFLTNWRPVHRRALAAFTNADWLMHEPEICAAREVLAAANRMAEGSQDDMTLQSELRLLERVQIAYDKLAPGVDLFPLPGYTPGQCGLLLSLPTSTTLITGDAVATAEHFAAGRVLPECFDVKTAQDSLGEVYEIADQVIPGHDNIFNNPRAAGI